jgi:hypothetical protein
LAIRLCAASDIDTRTLWLSWVLWVQPMAWLRRYPIHLGPATRRNSGPQWGYSSQFHPVRQSHGFVSGWDAVVAVEAGPASLALDFKWLIAHFADADEHHIVSLTAIA